MASLLSLDNVPAEMKKRLKWKPFKENIVSDSELHFYLEVPCYKVLPTFRGYGLLTQPC